MSLSGVSAVEEHPSIEELVDYSDGRLGSHRETEIDLHVGRCDACAEQASRVRFLSNIAEGLSAAAIRQAGAEARVVGALDRAHAAPECARWVERLARWAELVGRSEAAVRVVFEQAGETVKASLSGIAGLTRSGALWPEFTPGQLGEAPMAARGAVQDAESVVSEAQGAPRLTVSSSAHSQRLEVVLDAPPRARSRLVMLVPDDPKASVHLGELRPGKEPARFTAVFENVPQGNYVLIVEPGPEETPE